MKAPKKRPTWASVGAATPSDDELIHQALHGDDRAWETLVRRYAGLVNGVATRYGLQESEAADVFQAVWAELWDKLRRFGDPQRLPAWLVTTAGRLAWQALGRRPVLASNPCLDAAVPQRWLPEEQLIMEHRWSALAAAVGRLAAPCSQVIGALYFDPAHPSHEVVAQQLDMPKETIRRTSHVCLEQLRDVLHEQLGESVGAA